MPVLALEYLLRRDFGSLPGFGNANTSDSSDPGNCPFCINDNDARIQYTPGENWVLNQDTDGVTTHSTILPQSSLTVVFTGSGIMAVGTISAGKGKPPRVSYTIDSDPATVTSQPSANRNVTNQPLFFKGGLRSGRQHVLTVQVDEAQRPYILNHFVILPNFDKTGPGSSSTTLLPNVTVVGKTETTAEAPGPSHSQSSNGTSMPVIIALSIITGLMLLSLLMGGIVFLLIQRKRKAKALKKATQPPRKSWVSSSVGRPGTTFTSEESILRAYHSYTGNEPKKTLSLP